MVGAGRHWSGATARPTHRALHWHSCPRHRGGAVRLRARPARRPGGAEEFPGLLHAGAGDGRAGGTRRAGGADDRLASLVRRRDAGSAAAGHGLGGGGRGRRAAPGAYVLSVAGAHRPRRLILLPPAHRHARRRQGRRQGPPPCRPARGRSGRPSTHRGQGAQGAAGHRRFGGGRVGAGGAARGARRRARQPTSPRLLHPAGGQRHDPVAQDDTTYIRGSCQPCRQPHLKPGQKCCGRADGALQLEGVQAAAAGGAPAHAQLVPVARPVGAPQLHPRPVGTQRYGRQRDSCGLPGRVPSAHGRRRRVRGAVHRAAAGRNPPRRRREADRRADG
mmetsp:Transcript_20778/g.67264  ORF Transcript_20778/g.67264 Transcript_20778/m.67264 type:complete len:333 (-) Transcript_20778:1418-2416(-)